MTGILAALAASAPADIFPVNGATINVDDSVVNPADATASFTLANTGNYSSLGNIAAPSGAWVNPGANAGLYEARATVNSGSVTSGTTGSWLALTADRTWTRTQTSVGSSSAGLGMEIRRASDGTVVASFTVNLSANVDSEA